MSISEGGGDRMGVSAQVQERECGGEGLWLGVHCGVSGRHCWVSGESGVSGEIEVLEQGYSVGFTACGFHRVWDASSLCYRCFRNAGGPQRHLPVPAEPRHPRKRWAGSGRWEWRRSGPRWHRATACPGW